MTQSTTPSEAGARQRGGGSFFGRRKGKTLRAQQRGRLESVLPGLLIDLAEPPPPQLPELFPLAVGEVRLEIGFGGGEHFLHEARSSPGIGFIGVEPFRNALAKAVAAIGHDGIRNVRLFDEDAVVLLDWLPAGSLTRIDLLYPDPWPKTRHWKRRFVQRENIARVARCLGTGGSFRFASDVPAYVAWTLREIAASGHLVWTAERLEDCRTPWAGWPGTRYEAKAITEGRQPAYLTFRKPG